MPTIDVQVHAYERNHPGRPWAGHLHGPESANGDEMIAAMDAVGVDAAILVSSFNLYRYDPSYALEVYAAYSERFRVVTPVDPTDPGDRRCRCRVGGHQGGSGQSGSCCATAFRPTRAIPA